MTDVDRVNKLLYRLKTGEDKEVVDPDEVTPPLRRAKTADEVRDLIARGADINERDGFNENTVLFWQSSEEVALALIAAGCDTSAVDCMGRTALHEVSGGAVKALIQSGADIHARDLEGSTPLHLSRDQEGMQYLIAAGADINAQDGNGWTPLHKCIDDFANDVEEKDLTSAMRFLSQGADISIKDKRGRSPIDLANEIMKECPDLDELAELARAMRAKADRNALNADDTRTRLKDSKPATPKKRGPL